MFSYEIFHVQGRKIKDTLVHPIVFVLDKLHMKAQHLAWLRIGLGILLYFYLPSFLIAILLFVLILLSDAFDGALARYQKKQSDKGAFVDIMADNFVHVLIIFSLITHGFLNETIGGLYLVLYPTANVLATIWFNEYEKTDWILSIRPNLGFIKLPLLIAFTLFIFTTHNFLDIVIYYLNIVYSLLALYCFFALQYRWEKKKK